MAELTQLQRSLRILQRLMTYSGVTVNELYQLFDKRETIRTIQRTLDNIQSANIPLEVEMGAHGERHYSLPSAFKFIPMMLSPDEILAALLLGQFSDFFQGTKIGEDIKEVFEKVDQLVPPGSISVSTAFSGIAETLYMHEPGKVDLIPKGQILLDLFKSILESNKCRVRYKAHIHKPAKSYVIHPYSLFFHSGAVYAIVFQPYYKDWIYLALQRINKIEVLDETFQRDPKFNLNEFIKGNFGVWQEKPENVKIKFSKTVANAIEGRIWHPSQKITTLKSGDLNLEMEVGVSLELEAWILRWGEHAKVVKPKNLKDSIRKTLLRAANNYS